MPLPRAISRSLLFLLVIAIVPVSTPRVRAVNTIASKAAAANTTGPLLLTPAILPFGRVVVGRRKVETVTITNAGDSNTTLLRVTILGRDFALSGLDLPLTLGSGESFTFGSVFAPRSRGDRSGSISFVSDTSDVLNPTLTLAMTGTGADADELTIDPAIMNFGTVQVGSSASQGGTLTAGAAAVTISSAVSSSAEFTLSGLTFPFTIPPGGNQGFTVTFAPQASGVVSATITFLDVEGTSPLATEPLDGVGSVSDGHSVDLSWNASTSKNVIGYNVYRGTTSGGPYTKINSVLDASTVYTDTSVDDGDTYYYVTTAVNSENEESVYSNEAQAIIPGHYSRIPERRPRLTSTGRVARSDSLRR